MGKIKIINLLLLVALLISVTLIGGCVPAGGDEDTSIIYMIVLLVLLFGVFYFLLIRPQRKRQREHEELVAGLKSGDRVITVGGIYGQIESLSEDSVVLRVESGATLRVARSGIAFKQER